MTDKELLELAAKAAGMGRFSEGVLTGVGLYKTDSGWVEWSPLTDDGDAFRLAVKLGLDVEMHGCNSAHPYACAYDCDRNIAEEVQPDDGEPYAATRRAIVRAAAEIGRVMQ